MVDGSDRVEFADVEVIGYRGLLLKCRVGKKRVRVPLLRILPGTTVALVGDRGSLVLSRAVALDLGLA